MVRFTSRITAAYLGRYLRAGITSSRFLVHYALSGVGSLSPTLRLRCRFGVFHRRAAPLRSPVRAPPSSSSCFLVFYVLQAVPLPGVGRQPQLRLALRPEVLHLRFVFPHKFSGSGLGLLPAAFLVLYNALSQYFVYNSSSSLPSGAAWWIPGGVNG